MRRLVVAAVSVALAGGCADGDDDAVSSTVVAPPTVVPTPPTTPGTTVATTTTLAAPATSTLPADPGELGVLDAALGPDGTLGLDAALALVAAGYGPVPGIAPAPAPLVDGGPALRAVLVHAGELREDQASTFARITAPSGVTLTDAAASPSARTAAAAGAVSNALAAFGAAQVPALPDGTTVSIVELPYANGDATRNFSSPGAHATALPLADPADPECRIRVNADAAVDATVGFADPAFVATLAREAFHCVQYLTSPAAGTAPAWVVEGGAAFAGDEAAGANSVSAPWWARWVGQPQRPLGQRTYDAIGFFDLIGESANAYAFAHALLGDPSDASIRRRVGADVFDRWGMHYRDRAGVGTALGVRRTGCGRVDRRRPAGVPRRRCRPGHARRRGAQRPQRVDVPVRRAGRSAGDHDDRG